MNPLLIVGLIFGGVGVIFLMTAIIIYTTKNSSDKKCSGRAYGEVVRILSDYGQSSLSEEHHNHTYYSPEIKFLDRNGYEVVAHPSVYTYPCKYQVGQTVTVMYDENDPQHIKIAGDTTAKTLYIIFFIVSGILLALGITMIIIALLSTLI